MAQVLFQEQEVFQLADGDSRVLVAPQFGARLLNWQDGGDEVIYWPQETDWSSTHSVAHTRGGNPILFPFCARHYVDGELGCWRDVAGVVRELPMHGFARELPFAVIDASERELRMRLEPTDSTRAMFPFEWTFDVVYRLNGNTLEAVFETTNNGSTPLPYYPGHHFYFSVPHERRSDWQIHLPCRRWGRQDAGGIPQFEEATRNQTSLEDSELIDRFNLEFLEPRVLLENASERRSIEIELNAEYSAPWYDVTTWTLAEDSDFFCVEPWLGLPNAIHHGHGLRWIESGQTERAVCTVRHTRQQ